MSGSTSRLLSRRQLSVNNADSLDRDGLVVTRPKERDERVPLLQSARVFGGRKKKPPKFGEEKPRARRRRASLHLPDDEELGIPKRSGFYTDGQEYQDPVDRVTSYCTCDSYRIKAMFAALKNQTQSHFHATAFLRDCVHIEIEKKDHSSLMSPPPRPRSPRASLRATSETDDHIEGLSSAESSDQDPRRRYTIEEDSPEAKHRGKGRRRRNAGKEKRSGRRNSSSSPERERTSLSSGGTPRRSSVRRHTDDSSELSKRNLAHAFVFEYGVVVCWGMTAVEEHHVLHLIKPFEVEPSDVYETDDFTYRYDNKVRIANDCLHLNSREWLQKLAFGHALAQSSKLAAFEEEIDEIIVETKHIPVELAKHGKIKLSKNQTSKTMGRLGLHLFRINLQSDILDTPDFFWDQPDLLEAQYNLGLKYLDVRQRVEVLNRRLSILYDLFEMLRNEQHNAHGSNLEIIVIILIFVEIVIEVVNYIFHGSSF